MVSGAVEIGLKIGNVRSVVPLRGDLHTYSRRIEV